MGGVQPKQYLPLADSTVIEQTLTRLLQVPSLKKVIVAIAENDSAWRKLPLASHPAVITVSGGPERQHSVLNGLDALAAFAADSDWVLVHDVARPCIEVADVQRLIDTLAQHPVGGILALPVSDTVKRVAGDAITETIDRNAVWLAQTPQMFRLRQLRDALRSAIDEGAPITDEASAIERCGLQPLVVEGASTNIKITRPEDLALAALYSSRSDPRDGEAQ